MVRGSLARVIGATCSIDVKNLFLRIWRGIQLDWMRITIGQQRLHGTAR